MSFRPGLESIGSSEELLRRTLEHSPLGFAIVAIDGTWLDVNPALCRIVGRSAEDLMKLRFQDITHPDDLQTDMIYLNRILSGEITSYKLEKRYINSGGAEVPIQLSVSLVRDEHEKPLWFISQVEDISERHRATELLDIMFEASPDMSAIVNFEGYFERVNPSWTRALGWTEEELMSKPFMDLVHEDDMVATISEFDSNRQESGGSDGFENRYRCKTGEYRWLQWNSLSLVDRKLIVANARDVTDQKLQASELRRSNSDLVNFAAIVSHDIKSPLTTVMGLAEVLSTSLNDKGEAALVAYVDTIIHSTMRMAELVDGVLAYSYVDVSLEENVVDMQRIAQEVREDNNYAIENARAKVVIGDLPSVVGDPVQLRQVLQNLVANALKAGRDGVPLQIDINATNEGEFVRFSVSDNGRGVAEEEFDLVFEPFHQGSNIRSSGAVGLGLATSKRLVERHRGHIWLESTVGEGTTVHFTIPRV